MSKTKPFAKRIVSVAAALTMTVGSVPMPAIAEETTIPNNGIFSNVQCIPHMSLAHFEEGSQMLDTGLLETTIIWSNLAPATIEENEPAEVKYVDFTATVTTQSGAERKPWWYSTTPNYEEYPMAGAFVLDGEGNGKMTFWVPCLGTEDGQAIVETAQKLLRHKVNGEGEEVTFDDLVNKIQDIFKKATLPSYVDEYTQEAFKTVDSDEQDALIAVLEPMGERFITENESGTPTEELTMTSDEQKQLTATVTGMMGLGYQYPSSGVAEGDIVTVTMDAVEVITKDDKFGTLDLTGIEPITFEVSVENNGKVIGGTKCEHDGDKTYLSTGASAHNIVCAKCNTVLQADVPHSYGVQEYDTDNHWTPCLYCKEKLDLTKHTLTYEHDDSTHWQECSGCDYKSEEAAHTWEWAKDEAGVYTGQICKCGAERSIYDLGFSDLSKTTPVYPEGKDENSEYTKEEAESIGLKNDKNTVIDKGSYIVAVETSKTSDSKWTVDYQPVEGKSVNKKSVEVLKACEHDGDVKYESTGASFHNKVCAKCGEIIINSLAHTYDPAASKSYDDTDHWDICDYCEEKLNAAKHTLTYKYDDNNHWQECSGCDYKSAETAHTWEWVVDEDGIYTGQKCVCGAERWDNIPGIIDLSKTTPVYPEGKDENSEYKKEEAKEIGLKDEKGEAVDKDSYTVAVEKNNDDPMKWTVEFKSVEDKSTGKKEITVQRTEDTYYAAVTYTLADGLTAPDGFIISKEQTDLKSGQNYSIESPKYPGFKPSDAVVLGTIGSSDVEITVTYTACTHTSYTVTDFIKPTCTEDSTVVLAACNDCGKEISLTAAQIHSLGAPYVATGHNFDEEWHREYGISSKPGNGHYHKCLNPGCYERQYEPHVWSGEQKSGTKCGKDFVIEDECAICGAKYEYTPEECKLVRTPEKDVAPTCEEYGFEKYVCSVCGSEASDAIAPLGHDMEVVEEEKADCETEGYKLKKCKREGCDHEEKEILEKTSKTGKHTWVQNVKQEPTCEDFGTYDGKVCTVCGKVEKAEGDYGTIEKLGHSVITTKKNLGTKPGVTKSGVPIDITVYEVIYSCTRCREHLGTEVWTVVTASKPPRYQIIPGRKAEITDMCNGIHISGNMAQDGGVYFRDQVMQGFDDVVDSESAKSKYQYKKIKANSFIIEFSDSFLNDLADGVYPVEVINGSEFWPLIVTVEDHKLVDLADQEYPMESRLSNDEFAELIEKLENDGAEIKTLFASPLEEEDLIDIQDLAEPTLDKDSAEFDKTAPADITVGINEGDYSFYAAALGDEDLTRSDYSFADGTLTISAELLSSLDDGEYVFNIMFTGLNGEPEDRPLLFTVNVKSTEPDPEPAEPTEDPKGPTEDPDKPSNEPEDEPEEPADEPENEEDEEENTSGKKEGKDSGSSSGSGTANTTSNPRTGEAEPALLAAAALSAAVLLSKKRRK